MYNVVFLLFLFLRKTTIKAANPASPDVMKENQEYIRKRRPINFTLPELEKEIDEENEGIDYQILDPMPGTSRSLPSRSCKTSINYDDKSSDDEPEEEAKLNEESTKNSPCDKNNGNDSDQNDWNPTGDPNYNPYLEDEHESWNRYCSSSESE